MVDRRIAAAMAVVLLITACSGGEGEATPELILRRPRIPATAVIPVPTAAVPVSLLSAIEQSAAPASRLPLVVAGTEGVFEVQVLGGRRLLIDAAVEFAIDDAQGGLLFQIHRGRPGSDKDVAHDSTIWWLPAGESNPKLLLQSTVEAGGELSLHDAYSSDGLHVIYSRHEATGQSEDGSVRHLDRLRSFNVATRKSIDLVTDAHLDNVSCERGVIAFTRQAAAASECRFLDFSGVELALAAAPLQPCEGDCRRICMLRWGGALLMLLQDRDPPSDLEAARSEQLDFVDTSTSNILDSLVLPPARGRFAAIDLLGPWLVVSPGLAERALVFDLRVLWAGPFELQVPGIAHFARAPLDVGSRIEF
jgi:hypothetical protein